MKYLAALVTLTLTLILTTAQAELVPITKVLMCDRKERLIAEIMGTYKEQPEWMGRTTNMDSRVVLTVDPQTGIWTLLEITDDIACVLSMGRDSQQRKTTPQGPTS